MDVRIYRTRIVIACHRPILQAIRIQAIRKVPFTVTVSGRFPV